VEKAMAEPKDPRGTDAITPQVEGGDHPRGTETKNYVREGQDQPGPTSPREGSHVFPEGTDPIPDARRNPGISSSPGTTDSGEPGIDERDQGAS
jgi:hypothetical protein